MESQLDRLAGRGYAEASSFRAALGEIALSERRAAGGSVSSAAAYAADLAGRTVCLTLLAGSGSRWVKSLASAEARGEGRGFNPAKPRGLYPVRDFLSGTGLLPVAAYALAAVRGLGRHLVVVRGWEAEIDAEILAPLGVSPAKGPGRGPGWGPGERVFFTQEAPFGKPLGHGDAAWQCRSLWRGADYVVTNFGGDANSRRTALASLLALDALRASGRDVGLLMPAAPLDSPAYRIGLDEDGLPRSFGHAKLHGSSEAPGPGYTNVGVRVYSAATLLEKAESFRERYWIEGSGYAIPGNDPEGHEFALDNIDAELAAEGRARILAIARPEELTPAKCFEDIPAFERAMESVVAEDRELLS